MSTKRYFSVLYVFVCSVFTVFFFLTACTSPGNNGQNIGLQSENLNEPVSQNAFYMGTLVNITIYDPDVDETVFDAAFERISQIEKKMTINEENEESEIIKLNNSAGKDFIELSPDTFYVLEKAIHYSELSDGKFDITVGPLVKVWNIGSDEAAVPDEELIEEKLFLVDYKKLTLNEKELRAKLSDPGMIVDLGAIAKGYAADEAAKILQENGVEHAIINIGGNILTINCRPDGSAWRLGIQDPFQSRGNYMGIVMLKDQSLVTSGTYERYFEVDGKRYHHILNPQTGYPEDNSLMSVSIIAEQSIDADALSTATFLLGLQKGLQLIESLSDTEAIFITNDKKVYTSSGINEANFQITKDEYEMSIN